MAKGKRPDVANSYVPESYEDLYTYYIVGLSGDSLCKMLLRSMLPYTSQDEREALAHDVFLRLLDKGMLEKFDPTKGNFGGVIYFTTRTIVVNYLDKRQRNPLLGLNAGTLESATDSSEFEAGVYSLDTLFTKSLPAEEDLLESKEKVAKLFAFAKQRFDSPKNDRDKSLLPLLNLLQEEKDPKECCEELGVTVSTVYNYMKYLRDKALV